MRRRELFGAHIAALIPGPPPEPQPNAVLMRVGDTTNFVVGAPLAIPPGARFLYVGKPRKSTELRVTRVDHERGEVWFA